ncbi:PP-loop family protein [Aspergillus cavernicola]|uniref:tRNA(Ile)-lysidine synthetase n=1 Tax=Aspergillus cavernicola TaxID=176166 RepID=A0ABR4IQA4_9EURO
MAASCLLRSTSTGAITAPQFLHVLQRTWLESRRFRPGIVPMLPRRLGLAVSGGADSMALAYLCKQWEKQHHNNNIYTRDVNQTSVNEDVGVSASASVTAFVVDHRAREESTQEANTVAGWLREMGIRTQILRLTWPGAGVGSAFETHARRLRFQALGEACRDASIEALLMGHHQDDNVETTLWRLASGARGAGLAGIPTVARIPECHGLHGVAESGGSVAVHADDFLESRQRGREVGGHNKNNREDKVSISTGGILLIRPLLSFPKSNLVATCHENGVPFVSDPTNFDPTLTPRNAIRSLLVSNSLPRALQNQSILSLVQKSQTLIRDSHRFSDEILRTRCQLLDISFATGSMTIQFQPPSVPISDPSEPEEEKISTQRLHQIQSLTLRRITELISPFPENHFALRSFVEFTRFIFPLPTTGSKSDSQADIADGNANSTKNLEKRKPFTLGGVLFQPLTSYSSSKRNSNTNKTPKEGNNNIYHLTRQPFMRHRYPVVHLDLDLKKQRIPPMSSSHVSSNIPLHVLEKNYSPWTLWDNRFWIRVALVQPNTTTNTLKSDLEKRYPNSNSNPESIQIVIRPLRQNDLSMLQRVKRQRKDRECIDRNSKVDVDAFAKLDREAPGQSRFTVPVLAIEDGEGTDRPLALPTMDLRFPQEASAPWAVKWEWKYKMIDLEFLKLMGSM